MAEEIPGPRSFPIIGNYFDTQVEGGPRAALEQLADVYGDVFRLNIAGKRQVFLNSAELLIQFTDERQFEKTPPPSVRSGENAQGLFTARGDDPDWSQAHRILMPAFGPLSVADMMPKMKDIASQMILKWARFGEDNDILLTDEFTRLTLDTIALCTMDYRFNSFYSDKMHPFVEAMIGFLSISGTISSRPKVYNQFFGSSDQAKRKDFGMAMMHVARQVINKRREHPIDDDDLLNTMLYGKDPKTGVVMRDELVMAQMTTFLIAGHETTSGLLSFAFMYLLQNPRAYLAAQEEVDRVVGSGSIDYDHLKQLKYLNAVLREAMRLTPTVPGISKQIPKSRHNEYVTICDGKYHLKNDDLMRIRLGKCMRDPRYFGEDAEQFRPERMHEDSPDFDRLMRAWKPFGNGSRACIGQNFAWQEAVLVMALVMQNFDMSLADPGYQLSIQQNLTIKPKDLYAKVRFRKGLDSELIDQRMHGASPKAPVVSTRTNGTTASKSDSQTQLQIYYGSNSGTCQALARKLASSASVELGLSAIVRDLDAAVDNLSPNQPIIIITSSYEGQPPDNAARFVAWLESSPLDLTGRNYAVFGCGHKDWHQTLHRVPKLVDDKMAEYGGRRMVSMGCSDVSAGTVLDDFEQWQNTLLSGLQGHASNDKPSTKQLAEIQTDQRATQLSLGLALGTVENVRVLTTAGHPEKRHMEIKLPADSVYEIGDYLAVLPLNSDKLVRRIMTHWFLPRDAAIVLRSPGFNLPMDTPLGIYDLLQGFFELSEPASKGNLNDAKKLTQNQATIAQLDELIAHKTAPDKISVPDYTSLFDLLEKHPDIKMPFETFLSKLLPLRIRQYSISSSPSTDPASCTITYSVVIHTANGDGAEAQDHVHEGIASNYLSTLTPGDLIHVATKKSATSSLPCAFRLPNTPSTPLLMFCASTGLAPFRGFIQQRAFMLELNPDLKLAPALLFVGCRGQGDRLYAEEFDEWQKLGAVDIRYAFSQETEHDLAAGCRYVADRILRDKEDVKKLWHAGAHVYICGSRRVRDNVRDATFKMIAQVAEEKGWDENTRSEKEREFSAALAQRAVSDIFD